MIATTTPPIRVDRWSLARYLAERDLARRYAGSLFGPLWALAYPAMLISLYTAIFTLALPIRAAGGIPMPVWMISGMVPWLGLVEIVNTMTNSLTGNVALIKRVVFPIEILPISAFLSSAIIHGIALSFTIFALWLLGIPPKYHLITIVYAWACMTALMFPVGLLLALGNVVVRDISHAVGPVFQVLFWSTPVIWQADYLPLKWKWIATCNPLHHIIESYRFALLGLPELQPRVGSILSFWSLSFGLVALAWFAFYRFKAELADYL